MPDFSERLRLLAHEQKLTKTELGEKIGTTRQTASNYLEGKMHPPSDTIQKIAKAFSVTTDYLLGLSEVRSIDESEISTCEYTGLSTKAAIQLHALAENRLEREILSALIENGDIQNLVSALKNSIIATEQFRVLQGNTDIGDQMAITAEYRFQKITAEIYKDAQNAIATRFSDALAEELALQKKVLVDAAKEARARLDAIIAEEKLE